MSALRDRAAVVGVGHTKCAKDLGASALAFTIDTCLEAIRDADIDVTDVDGIAGMEGPGAAASPLHTWVSAVPPA